MPIRTMLLILCVLGLAFVSHANVIGGEQRIIGPRPMPHPDPISEALGAARVLPSITHGGVQIYPVTLSHGQYSPTRLLPLHEAFRRGVIEVREADRMDQYRLYVRNYGQVPVYGQGGDFFQGGQQDRFSRKDFIVPPGGEWMPVDVYCAERGRSSGPSQLFDPRLTLGTPRLRGMVIAGAQGEVWDEIGRLRRSVPGIDDRSSSYGAVIESQAVRDELEAPEALIARDSMPDDAVGVVCLVNGRTPGLDVYGDQDLFEAMWPAVLDSYLTEAARLGPVRTVQGSILDAREALQRTAEADRRQVTSVGLGETWMLDGRGTAVGGALTFDGRLVHIAMVSSMPEIHFQPEVFQR